MIADTPFRLHPVIVVALAAGFALALHEASHLEFRWFAVIVIAVALVSTAMVFAAVFSQFLLIALIFALPFASLVKWIWTGKYSGEDLGGIVYGGTLGIGIIDLLLAGLYTTWLWRLLVTRNGVVPRVEPLDVWIVLFFLAHVISAFAAYDPVLSLFSAQYFGKYALFYLYVSRHLERRYLGWLVAAFCLTVLLQGALGVFQFTTGQLVGVALDKGAGGDQINSQYVVPGIEQSSRATGTTYDSHAFGDLMGMLLPFALVFLLKPGRYRAFWIVFVLATMIALIGVFISLSRAAWLATLIALAFGALIMIVRWREADVVQRLVFCALAALPAVVVVAGFIYARFENSPVETVTVRFDSYMIALEIFGANPFIGIGAANYMLALDRYSHNWSEQIIVHNQPLLFAVEMGIVGLVCYIGLVWCTFSRFHRLSASPIEIVRRLAVAGQMALVLNTIDWMISPLMREPTCWTMLWLLISLAFALTVIAREGEPAPYGAQRAGDVPSRIDSAALQGHTA
ncbi:MAG: O-antigen ligase family protein [Hyphomicrobiaceae bacterium]